MVIICVKFALQSSRMATLFLLFVVLCSSGKVFGAEWTPCESSEERGSAQYIVIPTPTCGGSSSKSEESAESSSRLTRDMERLEEQVEELSDILSDFRRDYERDIGELQDALRDAESKI